MKIFVNLKDSDKTIEVNYYINNSTANIELPEGYDFVIFKQDSYGNYSEFALTSDSNVNFEFLPLGYNYFFIKAFKDGKLIWETNEFAIKIEHLEAYNDMFQNEVHLYWNYVMGADGYMIYKRTDENTFTSFKDVTRNNAVLYAVPNDTEIKIRPYIYVNGFRSYDFPSAKLKVNEEKELLVVVYNWSVQVNINKSFAKLFWKHVKNANSYKIYRIVQGKEILIDIVTDNEYIAKYLPVGTSYFCIRAYFKDRCLCKSLVTPCKIQTLELFSLNYDNKIMLYWNNVSGFDGYRVFKKNENGEFAGFLTVTDEKAVINDVTSGEVCEFKVKPFILNDGNREYTDLQAKCKIKVYSSSKIGLYVNEAYGDKLALSWNFDGDLDGFDIFKNGSFYLHVTNPLAHIEMIDYSEDNFQVKGYKKLYDEIVYTCASDSISVNNRCNRMYKPVPADCKISVIIPAYNSQAFLSRAVSTVLASDIDNIQIIIVDDGSGDDTKKIINWYTDRYPQYIKSIFQKNSGAAEARNSGIREVARGGGNISPFLIAMT